MNASFHQIDMMLLRDARVSHVFNIVQEDLLCQDIVGKLRERASCLTNRDPLGDPHREAVTTTFISLLHQSHTAAVI